jgi:hypothetical protein
VYALVKVGELDSATIVACRRIPYSDLVDYVERLRMRRSERRGHEP